VALLKAAKETGVVLTFSRWPGIGAPEGRTFGFGAKSVDTYLIRLRRSVARDVIRFGVGLLRGANMVQEGQGLLKDLMLLKAPPVLFTGHADGLKGFSGIH
jgi:hypothetical protein